MTVTGRLKTVTLRGQTVYADRLVPPCSAKQVVGILSPPLMQATHTQRRDR